MCSAGELRAEGKEPGFPLSFQQRHKSAQQMVLEGICPNIILSVYFVQEAQRGKQPCRGSSRTRTRCWPPLLHACVCCISVSVVSLTVQDSLRSWDLRSRCFWKPTLHAAHPAHATVIRKMTSLLKPTELKTVTSNKQTQINIQTGFQSFESACLLFLHHSTPAPPSPIPINPPHI